MSSAPERPAPDQVDDSPPRVVACVGAVVRDAEGAFLLVRRARDPQAGRWSLPGGRVEPGETLEEALAREVWEETGYEVAVGGLVGTVSIPAAENTVYVVADHACAVVGGALQAGDDAAEARWVHPELMRRLPLTTDLIETLVGWGVLEP